MSMPIEPKGPLAGIRILDAASLLAAPTAATLLSEYGAEIIKVEQPGPGDTMRRYPPFEGDISLLWKVVGKNRRSITCDMRQEAGRDLVRRLAVNCDIVLMNYKPATLERWNLDFEDFVKIKKDIIFFHLSAYGREGPYSDRPGFARVAEAFAGLTHRTGFAGEEPAQSGYPMLGDGVAGLYGAFAIMLALRERDRTGEAQMIDLALYEPLLRLIEDQIIAFDQDKVSPSRIGNSNPMICPNGLFPTKDDRFVSIPASTEPLWQRLIALMETPDLAPYDSNRMRLQHRALIEGKVEAWTRRHSLLELVDKCAAAGIACGPVYSVEEILSDPQIAARGSVISFNDPDTGKALRLASSAGRFSGFAGQVRNLGPNLGEHTDEILRNVLGASTDEIAALRAQKVI